MCGLTCGAAYDRQGSAQDSATGRQSGAEETQGQEQGHPTAGLTQCLAQAVHVQLVEGEDLARIQLGEAFRQHVAHRAELPPTLAAESDEKLTFSGQMQHELFDVTALSEEEADEAPVAPF